MSIFNDKALKSVADAVAKIMDEELKGNQHKIDANKNGKVDAHDFKLLRGKKTMKEEDQIDEAFPKKKTQSPDEQHKVVAGVRDAMRKGYDNVQKGRDERAAARFVAKLKYGINNSEKIDEAFPTVADGEKSLRAAKMAGKLKEEEQLDEYESKNGVYKNKGSYGTSHNTDDEDDEKKTKGYGARQNANQRGKSVGAKLSKNYDEKDKDTGVRKSPGRVIKTKTGLIHKMNESLSFTEMLELYNESGVEVINKIFPQTVKFGDTEVELIDANEVNGVVGITVAEEVDNETFTKELNAQKAKNAGGGKKAEVAKPSVQAVKQEEVKLDEALQADKKVGSHTIKHTKSDSTSGYEGGDREKSKTKAHHYDVHDSAGKEVGKFVHHITHRPSGRKEHNFYGGIGNKNMASHGNSDHTSIHSYLKPHLSEEVQIDEAKEKKPEYDKNKVVNAVQAAMLKSRGNVIAGRAERAAARLAAKVKHGMKEDVEQIDERTLTPSETSKKEEIVKSMKKGLSGFKARYGDDAKSVMYATATKQAKKD